MELALAANELLMAFRKGPQEFERAASLVSTMRPLDSGDAERGEVLGAAVDGLLGSGPRAACLSLLEHLSILPGDDVWGGHWMSIE